MVARMNAKSKNHSGFLRALALIRDQIPNLEALLVGDGPLRSGLEQEARDLGLSQNIRFLGDRRDIPAVFAALDLSVLPSLSESLSNSIIESMAQAVPVVAARVGGNEELLGGGRGILVPPGDDRALASAILDLVRDEPHRKRMGAAGQRFAQEHFTIEQMSRQHERLYMDLLQRKR
jgi:glycosyltransferase involved in cell wall biosynthesis